MRGKIWDESFVSCYNGHIGLNAIGGSVGLIKDYKFVPTDYQKGGRSLSVDSYLTGAIAYYNLAVYGDYVKGVWEWSAVASLKSR